MRRCFPVRDKRHIVSMGEGWTPLIRARRLGARIGAEDLWVKDEGLNPTGSFKARGLVLRDFDVLGAGDHEDGDSVGGKCGRSDGGVRRCGRNGSAHLHAERRAAGKLHRMQSHGAHVTLVDGLISDCGRIVAERKAGGRLVRCHPR